MGRADADITTIVDGQRVLDQVWQAIGRHVTQTSPYEGVSPALVEKFVRFDHLIRQVPAWRGGSQETALVGL